MDNNSQRRDLTNLSLMRRVMLLLIALIISPASIAYCLTEITALPFTASQNGETYILSRDLSTSGNGLNVKCSDCVIDLNGNTLRFGSSGDANSYGVQLLKANNTVVRDGWIRQEGLGSNSNCLVLSTCHNVLIQNVSMEINGHNGKCVVCPSGSFDEKHTYNIEISGGTFISNVTTFDSRCNFDAAVLSLGNVEADDILIDEFHFIVHDIHVIKAPHANIHCNRGKYLIYNCQLTADARNDKYPLDLDTSFSTCAGAANAYLIATSELFPGSVIRNNVLTSGNNFAGSRGINLEESRGDSLNPIEVFGNLINVHNGPTTYSRGGVVWGIRIRWSSKWLNVHDNEITVTADSDSSTTSIGQSAHGVYWTTSWAEGEVKHQEFGNNVIFERNRVRAISLDSNVTIASAISMEQPDSALRRISNPGVGLPRQNFSRNNHYLSNHVIVRLGEDAIANDIQMVGDTMSFFYPAYSSKYGSFRIAPSTFFVGLYLHHNRGNVASDCAFLNGASASDVFFKLVTQKDTLGSDLRFQQTIRIAAKGVDGNFVPDAQIKVINGYGKIVATGYTDLSGKFVSPVTYLYKASDPLPYELPSFEDSVGYNPITVTARMALDSNSITFVLQENLPLLVLTLSNTTSSGCDIPPSSPLLLSPAPSLLVSSGIPVLWVRNVVKHGCAGPARYHYQISQDSAFATVAVENSNVIEGSDSTSFTCPFRLDGTRSYFWRVRARNGFSWSSWSARRMFSVPNAIPGRPINVAPGNGEIIVGSRTTFRVDNAFDADYDSLTYTFYVYSNSSLTKLVRVSNPMPEGKISTDWTEDLTLPIGTYYWRTRANDGEAWGAWSSATNFVLHSVILEAEEGPIPIYPLTGQLVRESRPTFKVDVGNAGVGNPCLFYISTDSLFENISDYGTSDIRSTIVEWSPSSDLIDDTKYYWRAFCSETGYSKWQALEVDLEVYAYPNPFRYNMGEIVFRHTPIDSKIEIYTPSGDLVRSLDSEGGDVSWTVTNARGERLASGVYLYYVRAFSKSAEGKLIILR